MDVRLHILAAALPLLLCSPGTAELGTAEEIDGCCRGNFPGASSVQTVSMNAKDRIGAQIQRNLNRVLADRMARSTERMR